MFFYKVIRKRASIMIHNNAVIRNRNNQQTKEKRKFFVLEDDLNRELHEVAQAKYQSDSQFIRESVRRNIIEYRKAFSL